MNSPPSPCSRSSSGISPLELFRHLQILLRHVLKKKTVTINSHTCHSSTLISEVFHSPIYPCQEREYRRTRTCYQTLFYILNQFMIIRAWVWYGKTLWKLACHRLTCIDYPEEQANVCSRTIFWLVIFLRCEIHSLTISWVPQKPVDIAFFLNSPIIHIDTIVFAYICFIFPFFRELSMNGLISEGKLTRRRSLSLFASSSIAERVALKIFLRFMFPHPVRRIYPFYT